MDLPPPAPVLPQRLLDGASLLADRAALLPLLPRHCVFAEVGVGLGGFSEAVLSVCDPALFLAIDEFRLHELPELWGQPTQALFGGRTHADAYRERFRAALAADRMRLLEGDSAACLDRLDDASVDVIYVDADHRYEYVRRDLAAAVRKVRPDGWIIVNDYVMVAELGSSIPYGVVNAAHEFMLEHDWGIRYFALQERMFCDVALRPAHLLGPPRAALEAGIGALLSSRSWRITSPLRACAALARQVRSGRKKQ